MKAFDFTEASGNRQAPLVSRKVVEDSAMTYRGHVKSGQIVLDEPVALPEGAEVNVELVAKGQSQTNIWDKLRELSGIVDGLPEDLAENHDHYLYGTPKRSSEP